MLEAAGVCLLVFIGCPHRVGLRVPRCQVEKLAPIPGHTKTNNHYMSEADLHPSDQSYGTFRAPTSSPSHSTYMQVSIWRMSEVKLWHPLSVASAPPLNQQCSQRLLHWKFWGKNTGTECCGIEAKSNYRMRSGLGRSCSETARKLNFLLIPETDPPLESMLTKSHFLIPHKLSLLHLHYFFIF